VFNIWKEQKNDEIEREFQNSPYFLGAANADFWVNLPQESPDFKSIF
jgi:hypothetical protein